MAIPMIGEAPKASSQLTPQEVSILPRTEFKPIPPKEELSRFPSGFLTLDFHLKSGGLSKFSFSLLGGGSIRWRRETRLNFSGEA